MIDTFKRNSRESIIEKIVFLSSDDALVNYGKHFGLIKLSQEYYNCVSFVWCFSHRLELALKDAVKEVLNPADTALCDLYYIYTKSSKNIEN